MALKSTIFKAALQLSDLDHHDYRAVDLVLARHPSETDRRMMVRLAAWLFHGWQHPAFTRGLSTDDEPDLWARDDTGAITLWVDVGLPDERRIRKACQRAGEVAIYAYGERNADTWRRQCDQQWRRFGNLVVYFLSPQACNELEAMTQRHMKLQVTLQDGELFLSSDNASVHLVRECWYPA